MNQWICSCVCALWIVSTWIYHWLAGSGSSRPRIFQARHGHLQRWSFNMRCQPLEELGNTWNNETMTLNNLGLESCNCRTGGFAKTTSFCWKKWEMISDRLAVYIWYVCVYVYKDIYLQSLQGHTAYCKKRYSNYLLNYSCIHNMIQDLPMFNASIRWWSKYLA